MKNHRILLTFFVLSCLCLQGRAQYIDYNQTSIFVGMAVPRTNLSDFAEQGLNVGVREVIPLRRHLSLMLSAEMFRNRLSPTVYALDMQQGVSYINVPEFYNVPVFAHLNFGLRMDRHSNFRLWTEGALGLNFRIISKGEGTFDQPIATDAGTVHCKGTFITSYDYPKMSLATQWGIGIMLFRRYSIGYVRYNLGSRDVTGTTATGNVQFVYDDGSMAPADNSVVGHTEFSLGKVRSRYHVFRFGVTF